MSELNIKRAKPRAAILEFINGKLMYQFRKGKHHDKIKHFVENEIFKFQEDVIDVCNAKITKAIADTKKDFEGFVKPSTGFGARIKFLFTGKF